MAELVQNHWLLMAVVLAVIVAFVLGKLLLGEKPPPYEKRPSLLTDAERDFLGVLQEAVDGEWSIQVMVRLADLITVRDEAPQRQSWQNRILSKHVDFLLCDHDSLEAILAVELDDSTHQRADRIARDRFLERALDAAGLPLLRVAVSRSYSTTRIRRKILNLVAE